MYVPENIRCGRKKRTCKDRNFPERRGKRGLSIWQRRTAFFTDGKKAKETAGELLKKTVADAVETGVVKVGNQEIFVETYEKNPRLVILGGGHVSIPVAEIGKLLGFHITVMDDREDL